MEILASQLGIAEAIFSRRVKQGQKRVLLSQAWSFRTYKGTALSPLGLYEQVHLKVPGFSVKFSSAATYHLFSRKN